ncbi:MAG: thioredoxin family protein [Prolixibacteraceae bacterium]|jgi:thioredoxin 1|nr:thioredoxin family protein [Prolixibacteraceae bacterium]
MEILTHPEQFDKILADNPLVLAYFSGENCNVCRSLRPKVEMLVEQQFPSVKYVEIKSENAPYITARYSVFSVPVVIFFVEGRDYIREARNISIAELSDKIEKIVDLYEQ